MASKDLDNRANQLNPNNSCYWLCGGYSSRPYSWEDEVTQKDLIGQLEFQANSAATTSQEQREKMKRDTKRVEQVVKKALGGNAMVYKGGSQLKRTNVAKSDNDLKIKVPQRLTKEDRERLGNELVREFGEENVDKSHTKIHVVHGEGGDIDIVPDKAEYFPPDFKIDKLGKNPFTCNPTARHAVRITKTNNRHVPGVKVEEAVLETQQQFKKINLAELVKKAELKIVKQ